MSRLMLMLSSGSSAACWYEDTVFAEANSTGQCAYVPHLMLQRRTFWLINGVHLCLQITRGDAALRLCQPASVNNLSSFCLLLSQVTLTCPFRDWWFVLNDTGHHQSCCFHRNCDLEHWQSISHWALEETHFKYRNRLFFIIKGNVCYHCQIKSLL